MAPQFLIALICVLLLWGIYAISLSYRKKQWWARYDANPFNFPIRYNGKTLWHSRAIAVASFIFAKGKDDRWYVLADKRGEGTPDFQGLWNCPCGFLDFNETCAQAASRETYEETGIPLDPSYFRFVSLNDDPVDSNNQNVTVRHKVVITENTIEELTPRITTLGEKNEVADVRWIPINDIDKYEWAFNHDKLLKTIFTSTL